ncbi:MAG: winged helix-turn-helix transcriptional regulator [Saprospirales bacterium]|nr:winged helix-turn-helix transcriptional regulator [Saprospirales bacterium]
MISNRFFDRLLPLIFAIPVLVLLVAVAPSQNTDDLSPEKINLALRRTADGLLRASGDSTSRIPAIEQADGGVWRIRLEQPFQYEQLPALLQTSLDLYGINHPYEVAVRRCADATIDLGYHQLDVLQEDDVPCAGREMPDGCHFIEVTFLKNGGKSLLRPTTAGLMLLSLAGLVGLWFYRRQRPVAAAPGAAGETEWLEFGNSRLDVAGQVLLCGSVRQNLTFRETKLLRLFADSPDRLLEREYILRHVWEDEGVLVGRSIDVFVSRLRKKLAADPSVAIVAVHGVGYRLETGKEG